MSSKEILGNQYKWYINVEKNYEGGIQNTEARKTLV